MSLYSRRYDEFFHSRFFFKLLKRLFLIFICITYENRIKLVHYYLHNQNRIILQPATIFFKIRLYPIFALSLLILGFAKS